MFKVCLNRAGQPVESSDFPYPSDEYIIAVRFRGLLKGWKTLRVGVEEKPAVGYTIARADVGEWIFEELIKKDGGEWVGKSVTLTS
ncbi:hypothetical protein V1517DRAFT_334223 [Lipomyces orientalis]|uniref:Uncharacterized protein n=1 Tax=Lipomyces orientalis TaxID=1233043 RepID=A0ACC3TDG8_9ASCO